MTMPPLPAGTAENAAVAASAVSGASPTPAPLCIASERLFAGATEVQIEHRGMRYRLKQTALGKLILTK